MNEKLLRPFIFISTFLVSMVVLVFTFYSYFYSKYQTNGLSLFLQAKVFKVPLIVYILFLSLAISLIVSLAIYFIRRTQYDRVEEKLRLLASGNYESPLFMQSTLEKEEVSSVNPINRDIAQIRTKILEMSKELQILTSRPELVDGESKEEILQEERHRLARELHDSVSQQLFAASMMLAALQEEASEQALSPAFLKRLNTVGDIINASQSEMRALLLHLRPITLEGKSLKKGIEQLLAELQTKIKIALVWEIEDIHLTSGIEDHLFRIVQELLSNTLRHAKAHSLEVYLKKVDQIILLRMVDDGVGFDTAETRVGSYGLQNIHERVTGMGGVCKIISFKDKGTSVEIRIPFLKESVIDD